MSTHPRELLPDRETQVHRALGDPSRARILEVLRCTDDPLDATEIAERVGLHSNTVRSHLRVLTKAGLVGAAPEERHTPGRPRLVFTATDEEETPSPPGYRLLAEILASSLANAGEDSVEQAEEAGRAWGRYLVDRKPPHSTSAAEDVETVLQLLDDCGFDPSLEATSNGHTVLMQHCPFGEVADSYRQIVCAVHLGLMNGALEELGAHVEADDLTPNVRPGVCTAHLSSH